MRVLRMPDERKMRVENERSSQALRQTRRATNPRARWIGCSEDVVSISAPKAQLLWQRVQDNAFHLQRPAKVLEAVQPLFDHVKARSITEPNRAIIAEGSAWYDSDIGFTQQTIGKILRRESKLANVY